MLKISELISKLEKAKEKHGDLEVGIIDGDGMLWTVSTCKKVPSSKQECYLDVKWEKDILVIT